MEHELQHDRRGLLVRRTRGDQSVAWEYDADGNRTARVDPNGTRTTYRRDAVGRVVEVDRDGTAAGASPTTPRVVSSRRPRATWCSRGRTREAPSSRTPRPRSTVPPVRGSRRDADARITAVDGPSGAVSYEYDAAGQLVRAGESTWAYDDGGRLVVESVGDVETRHEYDAAGQLVATTTEAGRTEYVHDGLGRRIRRTAANGSTTEYAWSDLGYLAAVVDRDASYAETGRLDVWVDALR
ncbi:RHS repeat domain-containing protein [Curtobacterium flaccumfaciens]|nr:RHS repeat domain-containing protein [Curtobacterium flaccumfaciens]